jgi:hypothetical protein
VLNINRYRYVLTIVPSGLVALTQFIDVENFSKLVIISALLTPFQPIAGFGQFIKHKRDYLEGRLISQKELIFQIFSHLLTGIVFSCYIYFTAAIEDINLIISALIAFLYLLANTLYQHLFYKNGQLGLPLNFKNAVILASAAIVALVIYSAEPATLRFLIYLVLSAPLVSFWREILFVGNRDVYVEDLFSEKFIKSVVAALVVVLLSLKSREHIVSFYNVTEINNQVLSNIIFFMGFVKLISIKFLKDFEKSEVLGLNKLKTETNRQFLITLFLSLVSTVVFLLACENEAYRAYITTLLTLMLIPMITIYAINFPTQRVSKVFLNSVIILSPIIVIYVFPAVLALYLIALACILKLRAT